LNLKTYEPKTISCLRYGYDLKQFRDDFFAGVTVAIVALPLAMALGIASGVTPEQGLFTAIVAGFISSLLGGSRVSIGGPTGAFVVIVYHIVEKNGLNGLMVSTLIAGAFLIMMGVAGLGQFIKFIPYPVTTGFTAGIAVVIASTQIRDFFGLTMKSVPADMIEKVPAYIDSAHTFNPWALAIGGGSLALLILVRRFFPRLPGALLAVVFAAVAVAVFQLPVETIGTRFGGIPSSLPAPQLPSFSGIEWHETINDAFTIALLCAIESLLCAVVADGMTGGRHRPDCELVSQGIANIASVFFGGIPATGAIARTTANIKSGARTPFAGMIHAVMLLLVLLLMAPLASAIPLAALAAILLMVAWSMSEIDHFRHLMGAPKSDIAVLLITFVLTVMVDLTVAVEVGMVLSVFLFMRRMSEVTQIYRLTRDYSAENGEAPSASELPNREDIPDGVEIFEINGPFFFGVAERVRDTLSHHERPPDAFILHCRHALSLDATALHSLEQFYAKCVQTHTSLILSGLHAQPMTAVRKIGLDDLIGEDNICGDVAESLERAKKIVAIRKAVRKRKSEEKEAKS
jgi:sulfate permease, SulP family